MKTMLRDGPFNGKMISADRDYVMLPWRVGSPLWDFDAQITREDCMMFTLLYVFGHDGVYRCQFLKEILIEGGFRRDAPIEVVCDWLREKGRDHAAELLAAPDNGCGVFLESRPLLATPVLPELHLQERHDLGISFPRYMDSDVRRHPVEPRMSLHWNPLNVREYLDILHALGRGEPVFVRELVGYDTVRQYSGICVRHSTSQDLRAHAELVISGVFSVPIPPETYLAARHR